MVLDCLPTLAQSASPHAVDAMIEAVSALADMTRRIEASKLLLVPSLFWSTVALLHTHNQRLYIKVTELVSALLPREYSLPSSLEPTEHSLPSSLDPTASGHTAILQLADGSVSLSPLPAPPLPPVSTTRKIITQDSVHAPPPPLTP